ncbi:MAG TPA: ABC transporter substrate-binding protein [Mycobacteriales bacterium]|nr:ABC transporter substrate-binding protein [Mycobacteriales bacterium]
MSAVVLLLAACGSRESHATLQAALQGNPSVAANTEGGSGSPSDGTAAVPSPGGTAGSGGQPTTVGVEPGVSQAPGAGTSTPNAGHPNNNGQGGFTRPTSSSGVSGAASSLLPGVEQSCPSQLASVNIASVGEQSGLAGAAVGAGAQAVAAWAAYVNSLGGLRCHPIHFTAADDGADPSRNASLTEQLVEQDHVVAFVYNDAPLAAAGSEPYLVQHDIPVIGNEGGEQFMYEHPNFFPQADGGNSLVYAAFAGVAKELTPSQRLHVGAISCLEAAECSIYGKDAPTITRQVGMHLVYNGSASLTAPDFTTQCLQAKKAGVQALFLVLDPNSIHRAAANCRDAGYKGVFATGSVIVVADYATDPNLNNILFASPVKPWISTSNPQIALFRQVLAKYAPGSNVAGSASLGWVSAQLLDASSVYWPNANTITSRDIISALDKVKNDDIGATTTPLTFSAGHDSPEPSCWYEMAIRSGAFVSPDGGKRECR